MIKETLFAIPPFAVRILKWGKDRLQHKVGPGTKQLRSPRWPKVAHEHLLKEPNCQWCGGTEKLQVHHIIPFSEDSSQELNPLNLVTLCEKKGGVCPPGECHLRHGHLGNFRNSNPRIREDCEAHALLLKEPVHLEAGPSGPPPTYA